MTRCPQCDTSNSDGVRFCVHCRFYLGALGTYCLMNKVSEGGFGEVYKGLNFRTGYPVAIKVMHQHLSKDSVLKERFLREAHLLHNLQHPHVVRVFDSGTVEQFGMYMVMEWLDGQELQEWGNRDRESIPMHESLTLFAQFLDGLQRVHEQGIIHRDLKPQNLMLVQEGQRQVLKMLDFGIAKTTSDEDLTRTGTMIGTPHFMAPEQVRHGSDITHQTDIYAAGVMLFWMLAGSYPFHADSAREILSQQCHKRPPRLTERRPSLTQWPGLQDVLDKALHKEASERFGSASQMLAALRNVGGSALWGESFMPSHAHRVWSSLSDLENGSLDSLDALSTFGETATTTETNAFQAPPYSPTAERVFQPPGQAANELSAPNPRFTPVAPGGFRPPTPSPPSKQPPPPHIDEPLDSGLNPSAPVFSIDKTSWKPSSSYQPLQEIPEPDKRTNDSNWGKYILGAAVVAVALVGWWMQHPKPNSGAKAPSTKHSGSSQIHKRPSSRSIQQMTPAMQWYKKSEVMYRTGRYSKAMEWARNSLKLKPDVAPTHFLLAQSAWKSGNCQDPTTSVQSSDCKQAAASFRDYLRLTQNQGKTAKREQVRLQILQLQVFVLKLSSVQSKVSVYRGSHSLGQLPLTLRFRWQRQQSLRLMKKGYQTCSLQWEAKQNQDWKVKLLPNDDDEDESLFRPCKINTEQ